MTKEPGRIIREGMGGFLNPPTHPEHTFCVEVYLRRRPENRGSMSLSAALKCDWLNDFAKERVRAILDSWQPPELESPAIQDWIRNVLGYFRGCYKGQEGVGEWHVQNMRMDQDADPMLNIDLHAGVNLIRKYYPAFTPEAKHFAEVRRH